MAIPAESINSRAVFVDDFWVTAIAVFMVASGYSFTSFESNALVINSGVRAGVLVLLLLLALLALLSLRSTIRLPQIGLAYFLPVAYMGGIALVSLPVPEYLPSIVRWVSYICFALFFYNVPNPQRSFQVFIGVVGVCLVAQWAFDFILDRGMFINNAFRVGGGVGSPIGFAGALFVTGFSAFYLWTATKSGLFLALALLSALAIVFTGTRSIFVAYAVILPAFYFLQAQGGLRKSAALILGGALLAALSWYVMFETELGARFAFESLEQDSSTSFRVFLLTTVLAEFEGLQALFGTGIGGFPGWFADKTGLEGVAPHFEFVWVMVEGGLVGSALYVICFLVVLIYLLTLRRASKVSAPQFWFLIVLTLSPQFVFQFANPNYFYQVMIPLVAGVAATLPQNRGPRYVVIVDASIKMSTSASNEADES